MNAESDDGRPAPGHDPTGDPRPGARAVRHVGRVVHGAPDPLLLVDQRGVVVFANPAAHVAFSPSPVGCRLDDLFTLEDQPLGGQTLADLIGNQPVRRSVLVGDREGLTVAGEIAVGNLVDHHASVVVHLAPEVQVSTIELLRRATHDDLTQLANRTTFSERASLALRSGTGSHALFLLDLDGFKAVNDGFGHHVGDQVLVEMARRLRRSCRPDDILARLGGDEFALWCPQLDDGVAAEQLAVRLLTAIQEPIRVGGHLASLSASIGIVFTTGGLHEVGDLLSKADAAMYRAKASGRSRFDIFDADLGVSMLRRRTLESTLSHAIAQGQIALYCEAIVDLVDQRAIGAEALPRWDHPHLGLVEPAEFVPIAARAHMASSLSAWTLEAVCAELETWNADLVQPLTLAFDLSPDQLTPGAIGRIEDALVDHSIRPGLLGLEIDEAWLSSDDGAGLAVIQDLRALGVRITIDHYGTGGLALAGLHEVPADALKLDRQLTTGVAGSKRQQALVDGIIAIAHGLDMRVIAAGVAHADDLAMLRSQGCDYAQGPAVGPAAPASTPDWLALAPDLRLG